MTRAARIPTALLVLSFAALLAGAWWLYRLPTESHPSGPAQFASALAPTRVISEDPFEQTLGVLSAGGDAAQTEAAIGFLDTTTRLGRALPEARRAALLAALKRGNPPKMPDGTWAHLFNSACNALAAGRATPDPDLLVLLEHLSATDPRHVIRLYALQHLGIRYAACDPSVRERLRALLARILADPRSTVTGIALVLVRQWETQATPGQPTVPQPAGPVPSLETARLIAADSSRPVDIRVTALHTAGEDPAVLATARAIAADSTQPAILRKVALYLIGRHGDAGDLPLLQRCSHQSPRLAQAGNPAEKTLQARLEGTPRPIFKPY